MKIVLDESVPRTLAGKLRTFGLDVATFPNEWKGTRNGHLIARIGQGDFQCLLTCDKNMAHQQNTQRLAFLIAVLPIQNVQKLLANAEVIVQSLAAAASTKGVLHIEFATKSSR